MCRQSPAPYDQSYIDDNGDSVELRIEFPLEGRDESCGVWRGSGRRSGTEGGTQNGVVYVSFVARVGVRVGVGVGVDLVFIFRGRGRC